MISKIFRYLQDIRIEIERRRFRARYKSGDRVDIENQTKAIEKAKKLSEKRKVRLWVVRLWPGKYKIYSKADVKAVLKNTGMRNSVNMYTLNEVIVHITK